MGRRITRFIKRQEIIYPLDFIESRFPPLLERQEEYYCRLELGKLYCREKSLTFLACCRDVAQHLPRTIYNIEKIGKLFKKYNIFFFESDSIDNTTKLLQDWKNDNSNIEFQSEKLNLSRLYDLSSERFKNISIVRNKYINFIKQNPSFLNDYICIIDADLRGSCSIDGILNSFGYFGYWDVISANGLDAQIEYYFDLATYCPNSFDEVLVEQKPGAQFANIKTGYERPIFKRGERLIKVFSAFGGMAFYRKNAFLAGSYEDYSRCDHIAFHKSLYDKGFDQIFINPSMYIIR